MTCRPHSAARPATPYLLVAGILIAFAGGAGAESRVRVVAGIPPVGWIVEQVGGERVAVEVLLPAGRSPHSFSPTLRQVAGIRGCRLLVSGQMPFERVLVAQVAQIAPQTRVLRLPVGRDAAHETRHAEDDPHWWLDPQQVAEAAGAVAAALEVVDPDGRALFTRRARRLAGRCERLDAWLRLHLAGQQGRVVVVGHPFVGALTARYGLRQVAIEDEGKPPTLRRLAALVRRCRRQHVREILSVRGHGLRAAWAVARECDARLVIVNPLAPDVLTTIRLVATRIAAGVDARDVARASGPQPASRGRAGALGPVRGRPIAEARRANMRVQP